jgi:small-conductance mechanosensitive channel
MEGVTAQTVARLGEALGEAGRSHTASVLLRASALSLLALVIGVSICWALFRAHRIIAGRLVELAEQKVAAAGIAPLATLRASRLLDVERRLVTAAIVTLDLAVVYAATIFILRQFPYTRPWGESMTGFLLARLQELSVSLIKGLPGLFTVLVIFAVIRFVVRIVRLWFDAVERGQITPRWIYPDTAPPTRRLVTALLWMFAIVVAYPYMPGSQTEAFKGISVFLGLMVTFGSSGLVNQIMSSFMITYSRALRVGDFVKIGDVEGTVTDVGMLSTKIKTLRHEHVTVPNAVVVSQTTTDYTRLGNTDGVYTPTSLTIGYDAPWRQVQALLLRAADRTPGLRSDPKPYVIQAALEDFYVRYTLFVCLEHQETRPFTLDTLHAHIQDLFNEYGVQIMSPNYVLDPASPKIVAKKDWFTAPAYPTSPIAEPSSNRR